MTPQPAQPHPLDGVDDLGEAVLQGLARPIGYKQSPAPLRTFITGVISFGFAPLIRWQKTFRQYATLEQQQLWHLADWVRRSGRTREGEDLIRAANAVRPPNLSSLMIFAVLGYVAWTYYVALHALPGFSLDALLAITYRAPFHHWPGWNVRARDIHRVWTIGLGIAYLLHFAQLQAYGRSVRRFLDVANKVFASAGLPPVKPAPARFGFDFPWILGSAVLAFCLNAYWGVAMMFAAANQRELIRRASTDQRRQLAMRLHSLMLMARPGADIVVPVNLRPQCPNELCRASLPVAARFCPRCGRPLSTAI